MFELDPRLTRASRRELHQKSAAAAGARRVALGSARAALVIGKAAGHVHTGSARYTVTWDRDNKTFVYRFPSGSFEAGPWAQAYVALGHATAAQFGLGQCHRLWGLLDAFARGKPYRCCERHTLTPASKLRWDLTWLACEALADPRLRCARGQTPNLPEHHLAMEQLKQAIGAWLDAPA